MTGWLLAVLGPVNLAILVFFSFRGLGEIDEAALILKALAMEQGPKVIEPVFDYLLLHPWLVVLQGSLPWTRLSGMGLLLAASWLLGQQLAAVGFLKKNHRLLLCHWTLVYYGLFWNLTPNYVFFTLLSAIFFCLSFLQAGERGPFGGGGWARILSYFLALCGRSPFLVLAVGWDLLFSPLKRKKTVLFLSLVAGFLLVGLLFSFFFREEIRAGVMPHLCPYVFALDSHFNWTRRGVNLFLALLLFGSWGLLLHRCRYSARAYVGSLILCLGIALTALLGQIFAPEILGRKTLFLVTFPLSFLAIVYLWNGDPGLRACPEPRKILALLFLLPFFLAMGSNGGLVVPSSCAALFWVVIFLKGHEEIPAPEVLRKACRIFFLLAPTVILILGIARPADQEKLWGPGQKITWGSPLQGLIFDPARHEFLRDLHSLDREDGGELFAADQGPFLILASGSPSLIRPTVYGADGTYPGAERALLHELERLAPDRIHRSGLMLSESFLFWENNPEIIRVLQLHERRKKFLGKLRGRIWYYFTACP